MSEEIDVPVIIVGGGPIGLTLANILGRNNVENVLLEKNETTAKWPKAMLTNPRSMELYRRLGLDTLFREKALYGRAESSVTTSILKCPPLFIMPLTQMIGKNPREQKDGTVTYDEEWTTEAPCRLSQIFMEPILKEEATKLESCEINFGWQVHSISQTPDHVRVEAINVRSGEKKVYRAQYLVGCDGGKSFVRKTMGINFEGNFNLAHFKSVVFNSPEFKKRVFHDSMLTVISKRDFKGFVIRLDDHGLFSGFAFQPPGGGEIKSDDVIAEFMDHEDIPYTKTFENNWQGHFAVAETLQDGRVFLAGDSAHIVIPVGGFGMNTGILDAYDIGWKLVGTINGWAGERLLASYTTERHHGIKKLVARIEAMFPLILNLPLFVFLGQTRPFKYILRLFMDPLNIPAGVSGILFGVRLETSPICIPSSIPLPPDNPYYYTPACYPGCRAPHFKFDDGTTLYDKLGSMFTLLHLQPSDKSFEPIMAAAAHCGIPLKVVSFNDKNLKKLYKDMDFVIIRPDLYVAWCGNEIPTLLDNDDVNEGARVLMKVITGGAPLPGEWKQVPRKRSRAVWKFAASALLFAGIGFGSFAILRHYKYIK